VVEREGARGVAALHTTCVATNRIRNQSCRTQKPFRSKLSALGSAASQESDLGITRPPPEDPTGPAIRSLLREGKTDELRTAPEKIAGKDGLAIHNIAVHGDWLTLNGAPRNGNVYYIGNVLSAVQMTRRNFGAGLYAPLRVAVYVCCSDADELMRPYRGSAS
jgi:hypothetical protein